MERPGVQAIACFVVQKPSASPSSFPCLPAPAFLQPASSSSSSSSELPTPDLLPRVPSLIFFITLLGVSSSSPSSGRPRDRTPLFLPPLVVVTFAVGERLERLVVIARRCEEVGGAHGGLLPRLLVRLQLAPEVVGDGVFFPGGTLLFLRPPELLPSPPRPICRSWGWALCQEIDLGFSSRSPPERKTIQAVAVSHGDPRCPDGDPRFVVSLALRAPSAFLMKSLFLHYLPA